MFTRLKNVPKSSDFEEKEHSTLRGLVGLSAISATTGLGYTIGRKLKTNIYDKYSRRSLNRASAQSAIEEALNEQKRIYTQKVRYRKFADRGMGFDTTAVSPEAKIIRDFTQDKIIDKGILHVGDTQRRLGAFVNLFDSEGANVTQNHVVAQTKKHITKLGDATRMYKHELQTKEDLVHQKNQIIAEITGVSTGLEDDASNASQEMLNMKKNELTNLERNINNVEESINEKFKLQEASKRDVNTFYLANSDKLSEMSKSKILNIGLSESKYQQVLTNIRKQSKWQSEIKTVKLAGDDGKVISGISGDGTNNLFVDLDGTVLSSRLDDQYRAKLKYFGKKLKGGTEYGSPAQKAAIEWWAPVAKKTTDLELNVELLNHLKKLKDKGAKLHVWTNRTPDTLDATLKNLGSWSEIFEPITERNFYSGGKGQEKYIPPGVIFDNEPKYVIKSRGVGKLVKFQNTFDDILDNYVDKNLPRGYRSLGDVIKVDEIQKAFDVRDKVPNPFNVKELFEVGDSKKRILSVSPTDLRIKAEGEAKKLGFSGADAEVFIRKRMEKQAIRDTIKVAILQEHEIQKRLLNRPDFNYKRRMLRGLEPGGIASNFLEGKTKVAGLGAIPKTKDIDSRFIDKLLDALEKDGTLNEKDWYRRYEHKIGLGFEDPNMLEKVGALNSGREQATYQKLRLAYTSPNVERLNFDLADTDLVAEYVLLKGKKKVPQKPYSMNPIKYTAQGSAVSSTGYEFQIRNTGTFVHLGEQNVFGLGTSQSIMNKQVASHIQKVNDTLEDMLVKTPTKELSLGALVKLNNEQWAARSTGGALHTTGGISKTANTTQATSAAIISNKYQVNKQQLLSIQRNVENRYRKVSRALQLNEGLGLDEHIKIDGKNLTKRGLKQQRKELERHLLEINPKTSGGYIIHNLNVLAHKAKMIMIGDRLFTDPSLIEMYDTAETTLMKGAQGLNRNYNRTLDIPVEKKLSSFNSIRDMYTKSAAKMDNTFVDPMLAANVGLNSGGHKTPGQFGAQTLFVVGGSTAEGAAYSSNQLANRLPGTVTHHDLELNAKVFTGPSGERQYKLIDFPDAELVPNTTNAGVKYKVKLKKGVPYVALRTADGKTTTLSSNQVINGLVPTGNGSNYKLKGTIDVETKLLPGQKYVDRSGAIKSLNQYVTESASEMRKYVIAQGVKPDKAGKLNVEMLQFMKHMKTGNYKEFAKDIHFNAILQHKQHINKTYVNTVKKLVGFAREVDIPTFKGTTTTKIEALFKKLKAMDKKDINSLENELKHITSSKQLNDILAKRNVLDASIEMATERMENGVNRFVKKTLWGGGSKWKEEVAVITGINKKGLRPDSLELEQLLQSNNGIRTAAKEGKSYLAYAYDFEKNETIARIGIADTHFGNLDEIVFGRLKLDKESHNALFSKDGRYYGKKNMYKYSQGFFYERDPLYNGFMSKALDHDAEYTAFFGKEASKRKDWARRAARRLHDDVYIDGGQGNLGVNIYKTDYGISNVDYNQYFKTVAADATIGVGGVNNGVKVTPFEWSLMKLNHWDSLAEDVQTISKGSREYFAAYASMLAPVMPDHMSWTQEISSRFESARVRSTGDLFTARRQLSQVKVGESLEQIQEAFNKKLSEDIDPVILAREPELAQKLVNLQVKDVKNGLIWEELQDYKKHIGKMKDKAKINLRNFTFTTEDGKIRNMVSNIEVFGKPVDVREIMSPALGGSGVDYWDVDLAMTSSKAKGAAGSKLYLLNETHSSYIQIMNTLKDAQEAAPGGNISKKDYDHFKSVLSRNLEKHYEAVNSQVKHIAKERVMKVGMRSSMSGTLMAYHENVLASKARSPFLNPIIENVQKPSKYRHGELLVSKSAFKKSITGISESFMRLKGASGDSMKKLRKDYLSKVLDGQITHMNFGLRYPTISYRSMDAFRSGIFDDSAIKKAKDYATKIFMTGTDASYIQGADLDGDMFNVMFATNEFQEKEGVRSYVKNRLEAEIKDVDGRYRNFTGDRLKFGEYKEVHKLTKFADSLGDTDDFLTEMLKRKNGDYVHGNQIEEMLSENIGYLSDDHKSFIIKSADKAYGHENIKAHITKNLYKGQNSEALVDEIMGDLGIGPDNTSSSIIKGFKERKYKVTNKQVQEIFKIQSEMGNFNKYAMPAEELLDLKNIDHLVAQGKQKDMINNILKEAKANKMSAYTGAKGLTGNIYNMGHRIWSSAVYKYGMDAGIKNEKILKNMIDFTTDITQNIISSKHLLPDISIDFMHSIKELGSISVGERGGERYKYLKNKVIEGNYEFVSSNHFKNSVETLANMDANMKKTFTGMGLLSKGKTVNWVSLQQQGEFRKSMKRTMQRLLNNKTLTREDKHLATTLLTTSATDDTIGEIYKQSSTNALKRGLKTEIGFLNRAIRRGNKAQKTLAVKAIGDELASSAERGGKKIHTTVDGSIVSKQSVDELFDERFHPLLTHMTKYDLWNSPGYQAMSNSEFKFTSAAAGRRLSNLFIGDKVGDFVTQWFQENIKKRGSKLAKPRGPRVMSGLLGPQRGEMRRKFLGGLEDSISENLKIPRSAKFSHAKTALLAGAVGLAGVMLLGDPLEGLGPKAGMGGEFKRKGLRKEDEDRRTQRYNPLRNTYKGVARVLSRRPMDNKPERGFISSIRQAAMPEFQTREVQQPSRILSLFGV